MIKVLIVDDSPTVREYLRHIIGTDAELEVAGTARDGDEAVSLVQKLHPDVVTMDIQMPRMNGYEATRKIMETHPVPIVVVSSTVVPEQVTNTFRAIKAGAVAVLEKPKGPGHPESKRMASKIIQIVKLMSEVKVVTRYGAANKQMVRKARVVSDMPSKIGLGTGGRPALDSLRKRAEESMCRTRKIKVVAIGASTGGPPVIRTILSSLTEDFPAPILLVQHIAPGFIQGMTEWLGREIALPVQIPRHGDHVTAGRAYFAPDGYHMGITGKGEIVLSKGSPINGLRPSVSHFFQSVAEAYGETAAGILLTGMGKDGAPELKMMRERGALTIAQNKESSVVHGMPGEAIKLGAATHIFSPEEIAGFLCGCI